ncbi:MAG TPA: hypothetical protein VFC98_03950 [Clostridia bacterium]|nr:hypothetical protein [Clostridia bacterium]
MENTVMGEQYKAGKIRDEIHEQMRSSGRYQGKKADYLGGKSLG